MRTTLTLEIDVAHELEQLSRKAPEKSFKRIVNETLRLGLEAAKRQTDAPTAKPFQVRARSLGLRPGLNLDNTAELLEIVEGADYK
jgi:hypothetical protein